MYRFFKETGYLEITIWLLKLNHTDDEAFAWKWESHVVQCDSWEIQFGETLIGAVSRGEAIMDWGPLENLDQTLIIFSARSIQEQLHPVIDYSASVQEKISYPRRQHCPPELQGHASPKDTWAVGCKGSGVQGQKNSRDTLENLFSPLSCPPGKSDTSRQHVTNFKISFRSAKYSAEPVCVFHKACRGYYQWQS